MVAHIWCSVFLEPLIMFVTIAVSSCWSATNLTNRLGAMLFHMATPAENHYVLWRVVIVVAVYMVDIYALG